VIKGGVVWQASSIPLSFSYTLRGREKRKREWNAGGYVVGGRVGRREREGRAIKREEAEQRLFFLKKEKGDGGGGEEPTHIYPFFDGEKGEKGKIRNFP